MDALTGLRGFAALWVVSLHFSLDAILLIPAIAHVNWFIGAGANAVPMFFILSGFILLHTYRDRFEVFTWPEYFRFLGLRLARIYPGYLAALAAMVLLYVAATLHGVAHSATGYPLAWLLPEALMLHAWVPNNATPHFFGWNFPDWSVSAEWFAYLFIFPLAVWLLKKLAARRDQLVLALLLMILAVEPTVRTQWSISMVSLLFLAGALFWELRRRRLAAGKALPPHLDSVAVVALLALLWFPTDGNWLPVTIAITMVIALLIFGLSRADGIFSRLLATRPMIFLGEISYSIYLIHGVVIRLLKIILPATKYTQATLAVRAGVLVVDAVAVLAAATLLFFVVEHPARLWLRRTFARPQTQR